MRLDKNEVGHCNRDRNESGNINGERGDEERNKN